MATYSGSLQTRVTRLRIYRNLSSDPAQTDFQLYTPDSDVKYAEIYLTSTLFLQPSSIDPLSYKLEILTYDPESNTVVSPWRRTVWERNSTNAIVSEKNISSYYAPGALTTAATPPVTSGAPGNIPAHLIFPGEKLVHTFPASNTNDKVGFNAFIREFFSAV